MIRDRYLEDAPSQLRKGKELADRAIAQISDEQLFIPLPGGGNSIAVIMKHLAGNMRSRWTDFLITDGEKPDRDRDREFEIGDESADELRRRWDAGWELALGAISALDWQDLEKTVTIRGEPHNVIAAINRQLTHYSYHVGQIVLLAQQFAGEDWQWLSIPPGASAKYEVSKEAELYPPVTEDRP
jgi:hypothetical protein